MRYAQCKLREVSRCLARQTFRCAQGDSGGADFIIRIMLLKVKIGFLYSEGGVIHWGEPRDAINRVPTIWTKYVHIFLSWRRILFILITLVGHRLREKCYSASTIICAIPTPTTAARFALVGSPMLRWPRRARL